ncbi:MAG: cytochrome C oxidase subunit IV family protein [Burkholderiaceae bacterium]
MSMQSQMKRYALVWLALMALLATTLGSAYLKLGIWNGIVNLVIAVAKAALVAVFFMHFARARAMVRLCAGIALFALALLFAIGGSDYATRAIHAAPWQSPQQLQSTTVGG